MKNIICPVCGNEIEQKAVKDQIIVCDDCDTSFYIYKLTKKEVKLITIKDLEIKGLYEPGFKENKYSEEFNDFSDYDLDY